MFDELLPFAAPLLLLLVLAGYYWTVFEPYFAHRTLEGKELMAYHARDRKLQIIAEYWAARLSDPPTRWYEPENEKARVLYEKLLYQLTRHRLINGDDPTTIVFGAKASPMLRRALKQVDRKAPQSSIEHKMLIHPNKVSMADGSVLWRGRPMEYKSRFNDFYPEP